MSRTLTIETVGKVGQEVVLKGWVNDRRNMGRIVFLDIRDREGIVQAVGVPSQMDEVSKEKLKEVRPEWVVEIKGIVNERGEKQRNPEMPTGMVEVLIKELVILNTALTPPFEVNKDTKNINEELRLKYRYLDLRTDRVKKDMKMRHDLTRLMREYFYAEKFWEIETPCLTKGTPEGAREFLVPSRIYKGQLYVLPQSPQQFKQLLMVGGMEKYFQIARCFRDEDSRGDRQPEFTQLDLEMSFVEREDVMALMEKLMIEMVQKLAPQKKIQNMVFSRLTYKEAMAKYGTDRPDLRVDKNDPNELAFCWVIDFPFFEKTEEDGWTFSHNPFSKPQDEFAQDLMDKKNIGEILTTQYDIVLNGLEIGGGSIRNHQAEPLHRVFEIMGFDEEQIQAKFGHMLEAFNFGAPPHGGIALGLDRIVALLSDEPNIREVIAFPKTTDAKDLLMGAPSPMPDSALSEANIKVK